MRNQFTEQDTETFYDAEDALYRSFWDSAGSLHWGWFDQKTGDDFLKACVNLNQIMAEKAAIDSSSRVLDMGCGNGNTATWLSRSTGCRVTGIDLSGVRVANANAAVKALPPEIGSLLEFRKASATSLPFDDSSFTHVWSQATIYHVHEKEQALQQAYRILEPNGLFVFDDLIKPKPDISETAQQYVYQRLLFDTPYSFSGYQDGLKDVGFQIVEAHDLSEHLKQSYQCLGQMALARSEGEGDQFQQLTFAYQQMVRAIENQELGWGMYLCRK
ncbi:MAG: methyltransferase domain-containing protein [Chloroflexi bacterium]|nr:methyltransferase domain-containing protein [Chloroflexota bacterium]MDA1220310.1 methyltransferase domain-containing protein [Chloroflexota bacterium]